ncbi:MAG: prephenate dehydratase [Wenzhouxiangellaceae bacterium]
MSDKNSNHSDLSELRQQIDSLDQQIQQLISDRARLALAVGDRKGPQAQPVDYYRPEREAQVLRSVIERNQGPLSDTEMVRLFREIMASCLAQQEPLRVAYLGPEGTFTQQAVLQHFGHAVRAVAQSSVESIFTQVQSCEADFGVVPVENSTQGMVSHTLDMFLNSELKICAEVELRIHQNLLTRAPGLEPIERVYSHPQSLAQCRLWLRDHLPDAELIPVSSNAEAARRVRHAPDAAAIAGRTAAEVYGLPVLFSEIEDQPDNSTRFLVIGRDLFPPSGDDKSTLLLAGKAGPGALHQLLTPLARADINMTRIESRPSRLGKWDYVFFVDVEGHAAESPLRETLDELRQVARMVTVLGAYPKALNPT